MKIPRVGVACRPLAWGLLFILISIRPLAAVDLAVNVLSVSDQMPLTNAMVVAQSGTKVLASVGPLASPIQVEVNPADAAIEVTASAPGFSPVRTSIALGDTSATTITLLLPKAQTIGGQVIEEGTSRPLAGTCVFINFPRKLTGPTIPVANLPIVTDANGRWQCDWLPAEATMVRVQVRHPDYEVVSEATPSLADLRAGKVVTTLRPLVRLDGVVLDPTGKPVAGAAVFYGPEYMLWGTEENRGTHTDATGHFRFTGIKPEKLAVGAYSPAFAPVAKTVEITPDLPPVTLKLGEPHTVSARVVDDQGRPLSDVQVRWDEAGIFRYPGWEGYTDADGRFQITNAPHSEISVDINKADYMDMAFIHLKPEVTNQVITLTPVIRFQGRVLEADSEKPVASFKLTPGAFRPGNGLVKEQFSGSDYQAKNFTAGRFDLKQTSPPIGGISGPVQIALRFTAEGFQTETVGPFTNNQDDLVIRLHPAQHRVLRLLTPVGRPAAGAELRVAQHIGYLQPRNGRFAPADQPARPGTDQFMADSNGVVTLDDDPDPKTGLVIHDRGYLWFPMTNQAAESELRLTPWSTVDGTFRRRGILLTNQMVALLVPYAPQGSGSNAVWYPHPFSSQQTMTDVEGRFHFDRVPAGDIGIARAEPDRRIPGQGQPVGRPEHAALLETIHLEPGQHADVALNETGSDVTGRIVLPPDAPAGYDWRYAGISLERVLPEPAVPANLSDDARKSWLRNWFYSAAGQPYRPWISSRTGLREYHDKLIPETRSVAIQPDGTFTFHGLTPGQFKLAIFLGRPPDTATEQSMPWERTFLQFSVPENAGDHFGLGDVGWTNAVAALPAPEPSDRQPFTVGISVDADDLSPRSLVPLRVRIRIASGHHIYAPGESSKTYTPLSFKLTLPVGWREYGDWSGPAPQAQDDHQILTGDLIFRHQIIAPAQLPDSVHIGCEVRAQACNAQLCWPPKTLTAEITIHPNAENSNR